MRVPILERLATGHVLVADGATGTMLQAAGLPVGVPGEAWILSQPEEIIALHRAYLDAGSQIILTSTFGGSQVRLEDAGLDARAAEVNTRAAELAREAAGPEVYIAGDMGPTGQMMPPLGPLTHERAISMFTEQARALADGGVDCIFIETMTDLNEAKAAILGAQQACDLPVFCSFSFDTHGRTGMGVSPTQAAQAAGELGVQATGANCGHAPEEVLEFLQPMRSAAPDAFLIAKPNAGVPRMVKRQVVYDGTPDQMADLATQYVSLGVSIVGTCCGSSPEHIAAIARAVHGESA